eukprot:7481-Heterococcus_DN1.PRE.2
MEAAEIACSSWPPMHCAHQRAASHNCENLCAAGVVKTEIMGNALKTDADWDAMSSSVRILGKTGTAEEVSKLPRFSHDATAVRGGTGTVVYSLTGVSDMGTTLSLQIL